MSRYGYARVSTDEQNPERQLAKFREMGIPCENVMMDKLSGKSMDRPEWKTLMGLIGPGDELALDSLDRLGRNYDEIKSEWCRITRDVGCDIECLDLTFMNSRNFRSMEDIGKVMEDMILSVLAWKAQRERDDMLRRQAEGIAVAKAAGKYKGGTPRSYSQEVIDRANKALVADGKAAAAKVLGCTRSTVYRMIDDGRLAS